MNTNYAAIGLMMSLAGTAFAQSTQSPQVSAVAVESNKAGIVDQRDVQVRSIDFDNGIIEMYNYGGVDQDLTGWRACSHDFDEVRLYTAASGFNGVTIEAGTSIYIHFNNDAPVDPDRINRSTIGGGWALPLDRDAYGLQMYFPNGAGVVSFGDSSLIADHLQWNIDGLGTGGSEFRTSQAVSEGLWTDIGDFIATSAFTQTITLTDNGDGRLHGPANYTAAEPCAPDLNGDGTLDFFDVSFFLSNTVDFNGDTVFDFFDVSLFLQAFGNGCP